MADSVTSIVPNYETPEWLRTQEKKGQKALNAYIRPARIKIIQDQATERFAEFAKGAIILMPSMSVVSQPTRDAAGKIIDPGAFHFVPVYFFPEWAIWDDISNKGQGNPILERTFDPHSEIARISKDPKKRVQPHPSEEGKFVTYAEHLNYIIELRQHPLGKTHAVLSFFRGTHSFGTTFASRLQARNCAIFACVFEGRIKTARNNKGSWYGIDCVNPSEASGVKPFIDEDEFGAKNELFDKFEQYHKEQRIIVDYDDEAAEDGGADTPESVASPAM